MLKNNYVELSEQFDNLVNTRKSIESSHGDDILGMINKKNLFTFNISEIDNMLIERQNLLNEHLKFAEDLSLKISSETSFFSDNLPFFDKFLWGIFGNKENHNILNELKELSVKSSRESGYVSYILSLNLKDELCKRERSLLHKKFMNDDSNYREKQKLLDKLNSTKTNLKALIEEADSVISSISSSEGMETLDMFTSNKGIALMSTISTSSTSDEIKRFQESLKRFYDNNSDTLQTLNIIDFVGEMLDFGTGFDIIMGFMQLDSLGKSKEKVREVREELSRELNELVSQSKKIKSTLQSVISENARLRIWFSVF